MTKGEIQPQEGEVIPFKFHGREREAADSSSRSRPGRPSDIHKILLASDFEVSGLNKDLKQYGLGVPLIGVREASEKLEGPAQPQERFYPTEMAFPLTAFLVPNSRLKEPNVNVETTRVCTSLLIDPIQQQTYETRGNKLALEIDLTTPLAYMWSRTDLERFRWSGLLRPEKGLERANLLLIRPYEPGKIPVVMVHGLISSPLAWIPMLNELLRDPEIQKHYQFLLYMYPTGVPIPIAAASLRDDADPGQADVRPGRPRPGIRPDGPAGAQHGRPAQPHDGGLDSGDKLWRLYSDRSFDDLIGSREVLDELRHYLFFKPLPFVSRVVFLATPHRGSDHVPRGDRPRRHQPDLRSGPHPQAALPPGQGQPRRLRHAQVPAVPDEHRDARNELADPDGHRRHGAEPAGRLPFDHRVVSSPTGVAQSTDGVVPYSSSHLDGVVSEKVVRSDHGVQKDQEARREVQRILLEHVGATPVARQTGAPRTAGPIPLEPPTPVREAIGQADEPTPW